MTQPSERATLPIGPQLKDVIKIAYKARRPVLLEGSTGIGKSEVLAQVARELGIEFVVLDLSLLEPPDLVGLPVIENDRTRYAVPDILPLDGSGILLLEELNRAERYIQQPALQLLTGRRLHNYVLPNGWSTCAAINPEKGEYQVTPMDPALRSRFMELRVRADRLCWLEWAERNGVHPAVIQLARQHDDFLEAVPPRTWKYVSDVVQAVGEPACDQPAARSALLGYLKGPWVTLLLAEIEKTGARLGVDVLELFAGYHRNDTLRQTVQGFRDQGQTDRLEQITRVAATLIDSPEFDLLVSQQRFSLEAFELLISDLPGDQRERLQQTLVSAGKAGSLLDVSAGDVLKGYNPGQAIYRQVEDWLKKAEMHHRVVCLARVVSQHLEKGDEHLKIKQSNSHRAALGRFLSHIGDRWNGTLKQTCQKLNIDPIYPGHKS